MSTTPPTNDSKSKNATAPAKRPPSTADIFRGLLDRSKDQLAKALPTHLTIDRFMRIAMTTVQRTPRLLECTPESLLGCLFQCAQLGLEPDGLLGQAYLIPFRETKKNRTLCTLQIGYRGYVKLARQSGEIKSVCARAVFSKDFFDYEFGLEDRLVHKPAKGDRGELEYAYCIFRFKDGGYHFDVMSYEEIEAIRMRSPSGNSQDSPWRTDYPEMAKKTAVRRTVKMVPTEVENLHRAAAIDGRGEAGLQPDDLLPPGVGGQVIDLPGSAPGEQGQRRALSLARTPAPEPEPLPIEQALFTEIEGAIIEAGTTNADVAGWFGVKELADLTQSQGLEALGKLHERITEDTPEPGSNG